MEMDFSSLWSWTIPLWGLFLLVLYLCGVLLETVTLQSLPPAGGGGGTPGPKRVRFSLPTPK